MCCYSWNNYKHRILKKVIQLTYVCAYTYIHVCSVISDSATPWNRAHHAPLSMGLPRQEYWSTLLFPTLGIFPIQGSDLRLLSLLHWQKDFLLLRHLESVCVYVCVCVCVCVCVHTQTCGHTYAHTYMYMYMFCIRTKFQITGAKKYSWSSWSKVS